MSFVGFPINVVAACVVLLACDGVSDNVLSPNVNDIQQLIKEVGPNDNSDDASWTNINKEVDMALQMIWPVMVEKGYTSIELPDMTESLSLTPLFLTYAARLHLTNGLLSNIEGISRDGDAMMTYHNKSFQFRMDLVIRNVETQFIKDRFQLLENQMLGKISLTCTYLRHIMAAWQCRCTMFNAESVFCDTKKEVAMEHSTLLSYETEFIYDFTIGLIAIELRGKVGGAVHNTALTGNFSISVETTNIKLSHFQILSFQNIEIRLKHNSIKSQLRGSLPRPLTDLFKDRIIAIVSDAVRIKLEKLIDDINDNDRLHFKEFGRISLAGLLG